MNTMPQAIISAMAGAMSAVQVANYINAQREIDARVSKEYAERVARFNREHAPKTICVKCLGVVGATCDCEKAKAV